MVLVVVLPCSARDSLLPNLVFLVQVWPDVTAVLSDGPTEIYSNDDVFTEKIRRVACLREQAARAGRLIRIGVHSNQWQNMKHHERR